MTKKTNQRKPNKRLFSLVLSALVLLGLFLLLYLDSYELDAPAALPEDSSGLEVHYLDVGQADSILLQCDGANMLIDGGNVEDSDLVVAYLLDQAKKQGSQEFTIPYDRQSLADYLGVERSAMSAELGK